ncbi:DciA family protein [Glutamicibacter ardleyensis]|uniref:DciA family protein n=1 Tax=Glutamicibacter ardleyensis TaxID=225894 RepID=UPI003FCF2E67
MSAQPEVIIQGVEMDSAMLLLNRWRKISETKGFDRVDAKLIAKAKLRRDARRVAEESPSSAEGAPRDPKPLGGVFTQLSNRYGWESNLSAGRVLASWESIVPEAIGKTCKAEAIDGLALVVRCENKSWVAQIKLYEKQLVELLCERLGEGMVVSIRAVSR